MSFQKDMCCDPENIKIALSIISVPYFEEDIKSQLIKVLKKKISDHMLEDMFMILGVDWKDAVLNGKTLENAKKNLLRVLKNKN